MRKLDSNDFMIATRTTSRGINRQIALNLVREHEPISRAEIAKRMNVQKSAVTLLVNELISDKLVYEGGGGETSTRGRKPTRLYVNTRDRLVVAIDIRYSSTYLMLCDFSGRQIEFERYDTIFDPAELLDDLANRVKKLCARHKTGTCVGIGVSAPGIVEHPSGRLLYSPMLQWRDIDLRTPLHEMTGLPVAIENAPKASALSQIWLSGKSGADVRDFVYLMVSDGVGVGAVVGGELLRGNANAAGEFGHTPLDINGPRCLCGLNGCWEAYTSNLATISRYMGRALSHELLRELAASGDDALTTPEIIRRARAGDALAVMTIQTTARYIGLGLATIVSGLNPRRVYLGGEISKAWDLIGSTVRGGLAERSLTSAAAETPIEIATAEYPRLRGAAALVIAPTFAAPRVG